MKHLKGTYFMILVVFFILGCAGSQANILERNYKEMSDEELLRYYYELDEEIAKCEQENRGTRVGVGTGVGGPHVGVGVGVSRDISRCDSEKLRERRVDVRMELKKRGLNP